MADPHGTDDQSRPQTFTETERINAAQRRFTAALDTVLDRAREEMGNYQWVGFEIARRNAFLQMLDRRIRKEFGTLLAVAPHGVEPASWAERAAQDIVTNKLTNWLHDPDTSSLLAPLLGGPAAEVMTDLRRRLGELIRSLYDEVVLISIPSRTEERPPAPAVPEEPVSVQPAPEPEPHPREEQPHAAADEPRQEPAPAPANLETISTSAPSREEWINSKIEEIERVTGRKIRRTDIASVANYSVRNLQLFQQGKATRYVDLAFDRVLRLPPETILERLYRKTDH